MAPATPASEKLERVLWLLPRAAREGGADLSELAEELGTTVETLLADLEEVTARDYYVPPGHVSDIRIGIEADRIEVWTKGESYFRRPVKLNPPEALALALALRLAAAEADAERAREIRDLAARLDHSLAVTSAEDSLAGTALDAGDPWGEGVLAALRQAARDRRGCRILYVKPGAPEPADYEIHPYAVVFGRGRWYLVAHSVAAADLRVFRVDRALDVVPGEDGFEVPDDFDPEDLVEGGVPWWGDHDDELETVVRYAPAIARWFAERGEGELEPDGSVVVRHSVADPGWLVRHVLGYGADAEVVEPEAMRDAMRGVLEALGEEAGPPEPGHRLRRILE